MRIHLLAALVLVLSLSLWPANKVQPLNIEAGLWQTTMTTTRAGDFPVPVEMLSRLTPEQRARLEARIKADAKPGHTRTYRNCLIRQKLQNPNFTEDRRCTWTTLESTRTRITGTALCNYRDPGMKLTGSGEFVALDRKHVKGSLHMTAAGNGRAMDSTSDFSSKWIGPRCGSLK